ncbi:hypothetical protein JNM87_04905 [Candidatus Saccharibacteria bacterium]|nr:hypothetical protein [Candidatus Saccharibacteria bacterium]
MARCPHIEMKSFEGLHDACLLLESGADGVPGGVVNQSALDQDLGKRFIVNANSLTLCVEADGVNCQNYFDRITTFSGRFSGVSTAHLGNAPTICLEFDKPKFLPLGVDMGAILYSDRNGSPAGILKLSPELLLGSVALVSIAEIEQVVVAD